MTNYIQSSSLVLLVVPLLVGPKVLVLMNLLGALIELSWSMVSLIPIMPRTMIWLVGISLLVVGWDIP